jgi:hypothetical protein
MNNPALYPTSYVGSDLGWFLRETTEEERLETFGPGYMIELSHERLTGPETGLIESVARANPWACGDNPANLSIWRIAKIRPRRPSQCVPVEVPERTVLANHEEPTLRHAGTGETHCCVRVARVDLNRLSDLLAHQARGLGSGAPIDYLTFSNSYPDGMDWHLQQPVIPAPTLFPCIT